MFFGNPEPKGEGRLNCSSFIRLEADKASCEAAEKHETFGVKKSTVERKE